MGFCAARAFSLLSRSRSKDTGRFELLEERGSILERTTILAIRAPPLPSCWCRPEVPPRPNGPRRPIEERAGKSKGRCGPGATRRSGDRQERVIYEKVSVPSRIRAAADGRRDDDVAPCGARLQQEDMWRRDQRVHRIPVQRAVG